MAPCAPRTLKGMLAALNWGALLTCLKLERTCSSSLVPGCLHRQAGSLGLGLLARCLGVARVDRGGFATMGQSCVQAFPGSQGWVGGFCLDCGCPICGSWWQSEQGCQAASCSPSPLGAGSSVQSAVGWWRGLLYVTPLKIPYSTSSAHFPYIYLLSLSLSWDLNLRFPVLCCFLMHMFPGICLDS